MSITWKQFFRLAIDPRIVLPPLRVMRELRRRGISRLPSDVYDMKRGRVRPLAFFRFVQRWLEGEQLTRHGKQWVLNSFLPPFPGPAYERLFTNQLSGRHLSPQSAFLAVTSACPNHCWHCSAAGRPGSDLSTEEWERTIDQCLELGASIIGFTGGEPCLQPDLPALVRRAVEGGAATIVFSSGSGVSRAQIQALAEAGLWAFSVSLDSTDPMVHNRLRDNDYAFEDAVAALRHAREAGLYSMIGMVATPEAVRTGKVEAMHLLAGQFGAHELRITEPMPCGKLAGCGKRGLLTPEQVEQLRQFHIVANRRGAVPKVCAFNQVESPETFGCNAGTQHLYIDAAGRVCPCDFTPLSFGNVREQPLAEIWKRMNLAMGDNPRRECFIQKHHALIDAKAAEGHPCPLPPEASEEVCRQAGPDELPDWFAMVMGKVPVSSDPEQERP